MKKIGFFLFVALVGMGMVVGCGTIVGSLIGSGLYSATHPPEVTFGGKKSEPADSSRPVPSTPSIRPVAAEPALSQTQ